MKKQISLVLVVSLFVSQFSAVAQTAMPVATTQMQLDEIEANYLKQLQFVQGERARYLQELRLQYEESLKLIDAHLRDAQHTIVTEFQPQLAQANAEQAVSLRQKMKEKRNTAQDKYQKATGQLKRSYNKSADEIKSKVRSAEQSLKNQYNTFKRGVKQTGQAAVNAAITSFANFGSSLGNVLSKSVNGALKAFNSVRSNFGQALKNAGLLMVSATTGVAAVPRYIGGKLQVVKSAVSNRISAVGSAIQKRWNNITAGLNAGKNKIVGEITRLKQQADQLKKQMKSIGSRPVSQAERAELDRKLKQLGMSIAALAVVGPVPVVAYHTASRSSLAQRIYASAKKKLMAPIQKMAASWRNFKVKMECFGNEECTEGQRQEAGNAFLKVYFTVYGLFVLAIFGTMITAAILEEQEEAKRSAEQYETDTLAPAKYEYVPPSEYEYVPLSEVEERPAPKMPKVYGPESIEVIEETPEIDFEALEKERTWEGPSPFYRGPVMPR